MYWFISMAVVSSWYWLAVSDVHRSKALKGEKYGWKSFFLQSNLAKEWCVQQMFFWTNDNQNIFVTTDIGQMIILIYLSGLIYWFV